MIREKFRASVDSLFVDNSSDAETFQRLDKELDDWGLYGASLSGGWDVIEDFQIWEMSNYTVLPEPGGWRDQPTYIRKSFLTLLKIKHWNSVNKRLPDTSGIPKIEDM